MVDICRPGHTEIAWLQAHYPAFHALHFDDVLSHYQRPKLDVRAEYLFLVTHFPLYDPQARTTVASEIDLFVGADYVITTHAGQLKPLLGLFDRARDIAPTRAEIMSHGPLYLIYMILDPLVDSCFPLVQQTEEQMQRVEARIFGGDNYHVVYDISALRRDLIALRHVLRPEAGVIADLERWAHKHAANGDEDFSEHFDDLHDHLMKIVELLDNQKDVIEGLNDTNNSLINAHINNVIKVLTIFSVVLLPLSLIAGIYGMNFAVLPLEANPDGFWFTMVVMIVVATIMLLYFKLRRWI